MTSTMRLIRETQDGHIFWSNRDTGALTLVTPQHNGTATMWYLNTGLAPHQADWRDEVEKK